MKLVLGCPTASGTIHWAELTSLLNVQRRCFERDIMFDSEPLVCAASSVTLARNRIAHEFLRSDNDLLLTVDSDHSFETSDFDALLDAVLYGVGVCGSAYGRKNFDATRLRMAALRMESDLFKAGVGETNFFPTGGGFDLSAEEHQLKGQPRPPARRYLYARLGLGVTLITREALEKTRDFLGHQQYIDHGPDGPETLVNLYREGTISKKYQGYTPEDFFFCDAAMEAGVGVAVHVNSTTVHWAGGWAFHNNAEALAIENGWLKS